MGQELFLNFYKPPSEICNITQRLVMYGMNMVSCDMVHIMTISFQDLSRNFELVLGSFLKSKTLY